MKLLLSISTLLFGILFIPLFNPSFCNAQKGSSINAEITGRDGSIQNIEGVHIRFNRNNWVGVSPIYQTYFYLGFRYADSKTYKFSQILYFSLDDLKEIDWKEKFGTGVIIRNCDGTYIDINRFKPEKSLVAKETINFYSASNELIKSKEINYYNFEPEKDSPPDWYMGAFLGTIDKAGNKTSFKINVPHDIRKIIFQPK